MVVLQEIDKLRSKEIYLEHAFVALTEPFCIGSEVEGSISHNLFAAVGYTPHLFRRPRLARWAPIARRIYTVRMLWRWLP